MANHSHLPLETVLGERGLADLPGLLKGDWWKHSVGHLIKTETTASLSWNGPRLRTGTDASVS